MTEKDWEFEYSAISDELNSLDPGKVHGDVKEDGSADIGFWTISDNWLINESFSNNRALKVAVVPDGITKIGSRAFLNCINLEKVVLPDSCVKIGSSAFRNCLSLREINIGPNVDVDDSAFLGCYKLGALQ